MPLQATSGAASYDGFGGGVAAVPTYIEDVFSTYLYTGNAPSSQSITNGIDLAGKGGLVWLKNRSVGTGIGNELYNTNVGAGNFLSSNNTNANTNTTAGGTTYGLSSFNSNGFTVNDNWSGENTNGQNIASWTFRKQPKFFDVVTATVGASNTLTFSHSLGSTPGFIMVKSTANAGGWVCYHTSLGNDKILQLQSTAAAVTITGAWSVSSTSVTLTGAIGTGEAVVAYLFAHNAGGFGLTGTDNVISCGSFTTDGSGNATVNLGYEPQWVLYKAVSAGTTESWELHDTMRGYSQSGYQRLQPNTSGAEIAISGNYEFPTATGFSVVNGGLLASTTYIYIAIRRGPMKVPTSGTSVFSPVARAGTSTATTVTTGFPVDFIMSKGRNPSVGLGENWGEFDRLRGLAVLSSNNTGTEFTSPTYQLGIADFANNTGMNLSASDNDYGYINKSGYNYGTYFLRRAPSFFDEVCYTGTGSAATIPHNLAAVPEFFIVKARDVAGYDWWCYHSALGNTQGIKINTTAAAITDNVWNNTTPTASNFYIANNGYTSQTNKTFVAYLFATCAGVSKVGSYTGTGTTLQVNCGFTGGARFVLIKRTDSTGDWYVWDSARGIVAGNDPYLLLNSTAAEVTSTDYIDTYSAGFEISSTAPAAINASGGTFIFLAIA